MKLGLGGVMEPLELLRLPNMTAVCAPMVRYSKVAFRSLVRRYGVHLAFTPMIVCESFVASQKARRNEFSTMPEDHPLIVQFAARDAKNLADGAELVYVSCDGVDINCGCPQKWALAEGYGASLMNKPQLIKDMVCQVKLRLPDPEFTVSVKTRIHSDIKRTVEFCRQIEHAGVSFISIHGRTVNQRAEPVSIEAVKTVKDSTHLPVIGNGDVLTLSDALKFREETGVDGVMSARGLLQNPGLFAGAESTPLACVGEYLGLAVENGTPLPILRTHLSHMLSKSLSRAERKFLNSLSSTAAVIDYLNCLLGDDALPRMNHAFSGSFTFTR